MTKKKISYQDAILEIEERIRHLEEDELDVDSLSQNVERVSDLLKICKEKLYKTEQDVENILKEIDDE